MDKKGYIRTLEAIIAIVIIFIFILSILPQRESEERLPKDIETTAESILNEIQNNEALRGLIFESAMGAEESYCDVKRFAYKSIPQTIGFELVVCLMGGNSCYYCAKYSEDTDDCSECSSKEPSEILSEKELLNIYTKSILIKGNPSDVVVKLLLWRRA